jgi:hypothetical protein
MTKRDKLPTNGGVADRSGARSRTKRRVGAERQGARSRAKKTRDIIDISRSAEQRAALGSVSGSDDPDFTLNLASQVVAAHWRGNSSSDERQEDATLAAMRGLEPRDPIEGMAIGQAIACHNAAMECYRRAMISEQTFEGWRESLTQGSKLSRTFAALVEALDRHRGRGQQRITVEHVTVNAGGQAIVGTVTPGGRGRTEQKFEEQPNATGEIAHQPSRPLRSPDPGRETVPVASGAGQAPVSNARWCGRKRRPHRQ